MAQEEKQNRNRMPGFGVLEVLSLLVFVGVVIVGMLPQLDLHTARQRTRDKQSELEDLERRLARLAKETTMAEIGLEGATRRLREQSTLAERSQAAHETEEKERMNALAARLAEESIQRSYSQTNHLLSIEEEKMRQNVAYLQAKALDIQAQTNALSVAQLSLDARVARLRQDERDVIERLDQSTRELTKLKNDLKAIEADANKADAEKKLAQESLNAVKARFELETKQLAAMEQAKRATDADTTTANKLLVEIRTALAQEQSALKTIKEQADKTRSESVTYQGQADLAKKTLELLTREQKEFQRQIDTAKAEAGQQQAALARSKTEVAAAEAQLKQATEDARKAREAESTARIGETAAQQRLEEVRREEVSLRKVIEQRKKNPDDLQVTTRAASSQP